jgi:hypothetical protein
MLKLHNGETALTVYTFGKQFGQHKFCRVCGTSVLIHAAGEDMMAFNVSLLWSLSFVITIFFFPWECGFRVEIVGFLLQQLRCRDL